MHRQLLSWEWFSNPNILSVFMCLLLSANHKASKWQGIDVLCGQHITSIYTLSEKTGLTFQQVRTALTKLKSTGEITIQTTNRFSLVTIVNWALYQNYTDDCNTQNNTPNNKQITSYQQSANKQITTNNNDKNDKNSRMKENPVPPTEVDGDSSELSTIRSNYTFNVELERAVNDWITYKCEKRQAYKPSGLNSLLIQVQKNASTYGNNAVIHAIHESMASNYQGIVWDKAKSAAATNTATSKGNPFFDYARQLDEHETILEGEMS